MALNFTTTRGWTASTLFPQTTSGIAGATNGLGYIPGLPLGKTDTGVVPGLFGATSMPANGVTNAPAGGVAPPPGSPPFLQDAINRILDVQANGSLGGSGGSSSLIDKILGSTNGYLLAPALAASMFKPGGTGAGGGGGGGALTLAPIQNPLIGQGYNTQANAQMLRAQQQQNAMNAVTQLQQKIFNLQNTPSLATGGGFYGSGYNTGQQLLQLKQQLKSANQALQSTSQPSGWSSNPPGY